ncbi:MAG TPA: CTP synthase [Patescibacteria group bacterium]|nr:CTP synthase [Patescibacteria group bacterium]
MAKPKYIFVLGGVISGVGKGTVSASVAMLLQSKGYRITSMKIDPYVNVDAGTMNPTEHGEVFVTVDGLETDQDIGTYERFLDATLTKDNYMTTGAVYRSVIDRERALEYDGKCVEVVPHIPLEVIHRIERAQKKHKAEVTIIEVGGTAGEYQNILFLEAARMMKLRNPTDVQVLLVSYLPIPAKLGEMKSKPTQYAVRTLNASGIQPDFIVCRAERAIDEVRRQKLSVFCNVSPDDIIAAPDVESVYDVPLNFDRERFADKILKKFGLRAKKKDLSVWRRRVEGAKKARQVVKIGVVGKYFGIGDYTLADSYISVIEALKHAAYFHKSKIELSWVNSGDFEKNLESVKTLSSFDGIVVPGGFGGRGVEGKIRAIEYVRKKRIPFFGLCYGMQLATIEFARNVAKMPDAHTTEVNKKTTYPVIDILPEQVDLMKKGNYGGTMRLGSYPCELKKGTRAFAAYRQARITERHRHRYELNNKFREKLEKAGLVISGNYPKKNLAEIVELKDHPWFVGVQFHPEFQSHFLNPHPLFVDFIKACLK